MRERARARLRRDGRGSRRARGGKRSPVISPAVSGAVAWSREGKERGGADGWGRSVSGGRRHAGRVAGLLRDAGEWEQASASWAEVERDALAGRERRRRTGLGSGVGRGERRGRSGPVLG